MALKYVDLAQTGTGHAGTVGDQYSWEDCVTDADLGVAHFYQIKGELTTTLFPSYTVNPASAFISQQADAAWRLKVNKYQPVMRGNYSYGIIDFDSTLRVLARDGDYKGMDIRYRQGVYFDSGQCAYHGCTCRVDDTKQLYLQSGGQVSFNDSLILCNSYNIEYPE